MAIRFVVLLIASLALAATVSAQCEVCQVSPGDPYWMGTCQPMPGATMCSYSCCLQPGQGAGCSMRDRYFGCGEGGAVQVPSLYFASKLPLVTEGSALRVRLGPAQPVERKCNAVIPPRRSA